MDPSLLTDDTCNRKERYKTYDCVLLQLLWVAQHGVRLTLQAINWGPEMSRPKVNTGK